MRRPSVWLSVLLAACMGCATTVPYTGAGPHPQIERGKPNVVVDTIGNVFGALSKLMLFNHRVDLHYVSPEVEQKIVAYLDSRNDLPMLEDTKVRLNQYRPIADWKRVYRNKHVAIPYRIIFGTLSMIGETIFPHRIFSGDYFNPWTNTVHLYSNLSSVALHELGHSYDISHRKWKGTYAFVYLIPFVNLYHEYKATEEAFRYARATGDRDTEFEAYKILYPAYASYIGSYVGAWGLGVVLLGHIFGRMEVRERIEYYRMVDASHAVYVKPALNDEPAKAKAAPIPPSPQVPVVVEVQSTEAQLGADGKAPASIPDQEPALAAP